MTAGVVGVLAEALAQHGYYGSRLVLIGDSSDSDEMDDYRFRISCQCGWSTLTAVSQADRAEGEKDFGTMHSAHVASVVAALPNIAIVQLPEPAFQEDGTWEWCSARSRNAVWINDDGLIEDRFGIGQEPEDVRMWAADLLAAVARAAGGQA